MRDAHVPVVLVGSDVTARPSGRVLAVALDTLLIEDLTDDEDDAFATVFES